MHCINRQFSEITGKDNLTVFSYSRRVKSPEWRWQWRRADLWHFEIFRHGPIIIYTRLPAGGTYCPICTFPVSSVWSAFLMPFLPFVYGYPSSSPCAHCTPNKSVLTLLYTRRPGPVYTGPCPKALTKCSPLDFWRSSIAEGFWLCTCVYVGKHANGNFTQLRAILWGIFWPRNENAVVSSGSSVFENWSYTRHYKRV